MMQLIVPDVPWAAEVVATKESAERWKVDVANEVVTDKNGKRFVSHRIFLNLKTKGQHE